MTPATLDAFRDHGRPRASLTEGVTEAHETMAALARTGISIDAVTAPVLGNGIHLFVKAFDNLLRTIHGRMSTITSRECDGP